MTIALSVFQHQVDNVLGASTDELSNAARIEQIKAAVERYSIDKPDTRTEDVTGDAGRYYDLDASLDYWIEGFSGVRSIQYPAPTIASDEMPLYLKPEEFQDNYWAESGSNQVRYLYLPNHAPAATEAMRIEYTVPYLWLAGTTTTAVNQAAHGLAVDDYIYLSGSTWTKALDYRRATHRVTAVADTDNFTAAALVVDVPTQDFFAVCNLAAAHCCLAIAVRYASSTDSTIDADSTAHSSRSSEFSSRAQDLEKKYLEHMGLGQDRDSLVTPSGEFVDMDTQPTYPAGRQFIFHHRGTR